MAIIRKPSETDQQLINRFNRYVRDEGLVDEMKERRFFQTNQEKRLLKEKKRKQARIYHY